MGLSSCITLQVSIDSCPHTEAAKPSLREPTDNDDQIKPTHSHVAAGLTY